MPTDTTARAQQLQPGAPDEADYHAFCTALSESALAEMPGATAMPTRRHC